MFGLYYFSRSLGLYDRNVENKIKIDLIECQPLLYIYLTLAHECIGLVHFIAFWHYQNFDSVECVWLDTFSNIDDVFVRGIFGNYQILVE